MRRAESASSSDATAVGQLRSQRQGAGAAGVDARLLRFDAGTVARMAGERLLLRLSDPVMLQATHALTDASIRYMGPRAAVMERCYDKYEASRIASAAGVASPRTALGCDAAPETFPAILKPRRGSDSIGVRILRRGPVPPRARDDRHIVQPLVHGSEITIGVLQQGLSISEAVHTFSILTIGSKALAAGPCGP